MKRVIVVDDVPEILTFFRAAAGRVKVTPFTLETYSDPREAVAAIHRAPSDVIISDFRMPHFSGLELLHEGFVHSSEAKRILMSGYNELPAEPALVENAHVDAYLSKPLELQAVVRLLHAALADGPYLADWTTKAREIEQAARKSGLRIDLHG